MLHTHRLPHPLHHQRTVINAAGQLPEALAETAELAQQVLATPDPQFLTGIHPRLCRRRAVTLPTPGRRSTGSALTKSSTSSGSITLSPSGLFQSLAILARNLFGATPAETVMP